MTRASIFRDQLLTMIFWQPWIAVVPTQGGADSRTDTARRGRSVYHRTEFRALGQVHPRAIRKVIKAKEFPAKGPGGQFVTL
jgi:hypothetical protein